MSTASILTGQQAVFIADGEEGCECRNHALIAPASGQFPLCKFAEQPSLYETPLPFGTYPDKYVRQTDPTVLMQMDGFSIEKSTLGLEAPHWGESTSWVTHLCSIPHWKIVIDSQWLLKNETCNVCAVTVPPGVIALWKMHNWENLKDIANQPQLYVNLMETENEWEGHFPRNTGAVPMYTSPYDLVGV